MKLDVLSRGDVPLPRRPALADVSHRLQLGDRQDPLRNLETHHRDVALPLAVGAIEQTEGPPIVRADLAALKLSQRVDKTIDVGLVGKAESRRARRRRVVQFRHSKFLFVELQPLPVPQAEGAGRELRRAKRQIRSQ